MYLFHNDHDLRGDWDSQASVQTRLLDEIKAMKLFSPTRAREINNGRVSEDGTINERIKKMSKAACDKKGWFFMHNYQWMTVRVEKEEKSKLSQNLTCYYSFIIMFKA